MSEHLTIAYCENCRRDNMCTVEVSKEPADYKGVFVVYEEKTLHCCACGCEVKTDDIDRENNKSLINAYSWQKSLIKPDDISAILNKYGIGKRPMSLLLGWGAHTLSRYLEGKTPSLDKSALLMRIADDSAYLRELADKNKAKLGENTDAYDKLISRLDELSTPFGDNIPGDILDAFIYLSRAYDGITSDEINIAMYFYFGLRFALYNDKPVDNDGFPCNFDTVNAARDDISNAYNKGQHRDLFENYNVNLSARDKLLLDNLIRYFLCYSTRILNKFVEIVAATSNPFLHSTSECDPVFLDIESAFDHFCAIKDKYKMLTPSDIRFYAEDLFRSVV